MCRTSIGRLVLTRSKSPQHLPFLFPPLPSSFSSPSSAFVCIADAFCLHSRSRAAMGERFWLLNASVLGKTYYPAGKVDPFWLNIALGDTVSYTQVPKKPNSISVCHILVSRPNSTPFCYPLFLSHAHPYNLASTWCFFVIHAL